jgi:hypothetical protein
LEIVPQGHFGYVSMNRVLRRVFKGNGVMELP